MKAESYSTEVQEKWGNTAAYKEYSEKTNNYSEDKRNSLTDEMNNIMAEFAVCLKNGNSPDSDKAQELVKLLQKYITDNYYNCTNAILAGLGQMYVQDERFKNNIDKHADGTAEFICNAIGFYCSK